MADEAHISVVVAYHCAQQVRESSMKTHPLKAEVWGYRRKRGALDGVSWV